jgi:NAD(P)-dependent dehydrogenase (short-subunit alcohol dehydrogenase family)
MPSIFITGANRGLGLEFARQYAASGWQVTASCRDPANATDLAATGVEILPLDVGDFAALRATARALQGRAFDILLNNAGISGGAQSLGQIDAAAWEETFRVNAMAPILLAEALLPALLAGQQKRLVFLTSRMGSIADNGGGGYYAYRASKAALNAAVKSLAVDLAPRGVSTLLLHPGWAKTDMGGQGATVAAADSVAGMRALIEQMQAGQALRFVDYRGKTLPW